MEMKIGLNERAIVKGKLVGGEAGGI